LHCGVAIARAALLTAAAAALALILVSGGSDADPRTPPALPGLPPPFLGVTVSGDGGLTAALDAYGDVVDLRAPGPAGRGLIDNPADRQAAGTVPAATGIVPRLGVGGGPALPLWRADAVSQRYLAGTNLVVTRARFGRWWAVAEAATSGGELALRVRARGPAGADAAPSVSVNLGVGGRCRARDARDAVALVCAAGGAPLFPAGEVLRRAVRGERRWLAAATPLGPRAPAWARAMYRRSLLVLQALTDRRTGAVAAGTRDGWAYVWPRDAATAALAYAAAGYPTEARRVAEFLLGLGAKTAAAARFSGDGAPVPGRGPQGDAAGWIAVAARAAGVHPPPPGTGVWRNLPDYQESAPGTYLANAIAATATHDRADGTKTALYQRISARRRAGERVAAGFGTPWGLVREAGDPASGLDSAAAWAVRPFATPVLYPAARRTLLHLAGGGTRFGITPGEGWEGGEDPWTAPTAWSAWSLAALGDRAAALRLLADLRRAATPAGALPERLDARTGIPRSTTPLAWSHAFAILALRQLWPGRR
jgi:hypothetical protein